MTSECKPAVPGEVQHIFSSVQFNINIYIYIIYELYINYELERIHRNFG